MIPGKLAGQHRQRNDRRESRASLGALTTLQFPNAVVRNAVGRRNIWGAANGGLRDGGLRKSEDIWGKRPFSSVFWIFQVLFRPSRKGRKRQKKGEKGRFRPISGRGGQTPLKPPFVTTPFAAAQKKERKRKCAKERKSYPETNYHLWFLTPRSKLQKYGFSCMKSAFFLPKNAFSQRKMRNFHKKKGAKDREETKGRFRKRAVLANAPSFPFLVPWKIRMYPCSVFWYRGNIRQNHPFGNHPFANPKKAQKSVNVRKWALPCKNCKQPGLNQPGFGTIPVLPFLVFLEKRQGKPPKKQGLFIPTEPLKSLEKKRKTLKKTRNSSQGKKTRNSQKTRKGRTGIRRDYHSPVRHNPPSLRRSC